MIREHDMNQSEAFWAGKPVDEITERLEALRASFPASVVGKLPRGRVQLDYVGHAAVTDRLLSVDPFWCWEPVGTTPEDLPLIVAPGVLWIRLTVCGVSRLGVGDGSKNEKELIGDAIRNAAMRFGVALELWTRDELESAIDGRRGERGPSWQQQQAEVAAVPARAGDELLAAIFEYADAGNYEPERLSNAAKWASEGRTVEVSELSEAEARRLLAQMKTYAGQADEAPRGKDER